MPCMEISIEDLEIVVQHIDSGFAALQLFLTFKRL